MKTIKLRSYAYVLTILFIVSGVLIGMLRPWENKLDLAEKSKTESGEMHLINNLPMPDASMIPGDKTPGNIQNPEAPPVINTQYHSDPLPQTRTEAQRILAIRATEKITVDSDNSKREEMIRVDGDDAIITRSRTETDSNQNYPQ